MVLRSQAEIYSDFFTLRKSIILIGYFLFIKQQTLKNNHHETFPFWELFTIFASLFILWREYLQKVR